MFHRFEMRENEIWCRTSQVLQDILAHGLSTKGSLQAKVSAGIQTGSHTRCTINGDRGFMMSKMFLCITGNMFRRTSACNTHFVVRIIGQLYYKCNCRGQIMHAIIFSSGHYITLIHLQEHQFFHIYVVFTIFPALYDVFFPPEKVPKISPCILTSKGVKTFHAQKYLTNYWVQPSTFSIFLQGKYCMSNFHKQRE